MKDLSVLALLLLTITGSMLLVFLFVKAIAWFSLQSERNQIEIAIQLLIIIVGLVAVILQNL